MEMWTWLQAGIYRAALAAHLEKKLQWIIDRRAAKRSGGFRYVSSDRRIGSSWVSWESQRRSAADWLQRTLVATAGPVDTRLGTGWLPFEQTRGLHCRPLFL